MRLKVCVLIFGTTVLSLRGGMNIGMMIGRGSMTYLELL